ncbi:MAG: DeoR/GlpR transcriptional regulator [Bergeyella sp.]|nr:DeoR/GlpR transcriptional regulator [Bergeyella sp.]
MERLLARHYSILKDLELEGYVSVQNLCNKYSVSPVTIRKDLNFLEDRGLLYRTHGGASKQVCYAYEKNVREKENINPKAKISIAEAAVSLVRENQSLILASGTTLHYFARKLINFAPLTVLTSSLHVALELCLNPEINIIQLGGEVHKSSASIVGTISESILRQFSCHTLFLGVDGIDLQFGMSTSNAAEAQLNRLMMECSDKVVVLADSSKLNRKGFGKIASLEEIDFLVTDPLISEKDEKNLEDFGIQVIKAKSF